jgi:hypothetical protein
MMKVIPYGGWIFYVEDGAEEALDKHKCGKWMYFFADREFVEKLCKIAVETGVVKEAKHNDSEEGVACFYLNGDDNETHKNVIQFFLNNNLIRKTKAGKLYNISFKFDDQTRAGEYGADFKGEIKLEQFMNLNTGEWLK